jgi:hypothetical protein
LFVRNFKIVNFIVNDLLVEYSIVRYYFSGN